MQVERLLQPAARVCLSLLAGVPRQRVSLSQPGECLLAAVACLAAGEVPQSVTLKIKEAAPTMKGETGACLLCCLPALLPALLP